MVLAVVVVVVVLGLAMPLVGWLVTRRPPPLDTVGRARGEIDVWLADQFELGWRDRSRVRRAVLTGEPVSDPALAAAARGFAAQVAADRFRTLRVARKVGWAHLIIGLAYVALGIAAPVISPGSAGWALAVVAVLNGGIFFWIGNHHAFRNPRRIRRNAEQILRLVGQHLLFAARRSYRSPRPRRRTGLADVT